MEMNITDQKMNLIMRDVDLLVECAEFKSVIENTCNNIMSSIKEFGEDNLFKEVELELVELLSRSDLYIVDLEYFQKRKDEIKKSQRKLSSFIDKPKAPAISIKNLLSYIQRKLLSFIGTKSHNFYRGYAISTENLLSCVGSELKNIVHIKNLTSIESLFSYINNAVQGLSQKHQIELSISAQRDQMCYMLYKGLERQDKFLSTFFLSKPPTR
jgi:hypothetical protein